ALGCPVISSNASVLPEILGNACLYFNPNDEKQLADSVERVLSSPTLRNELISAGHYQSAKYSWKTTAKRTLEVYQSLL
ncbi:glycosyltransferase, partial [Synechococcus sp. BA-120 BA3]|nr:glycosyltransferase [Synechococcus sp. BA-120 BA3]